ncbi:MAG: TIGR02757 family protein [Bacteroidetes bacterium]|nr:TIGR02757 family protein [Bacteroidota bacterium]
MLDASEINNIKTFLDDKVHEFNRVSFIELDPISIPHRFSSKEDIEISGFLAATLAWGNRKSIIQNANKLMDDMGESPFDFVMNASSQQLKKLQFVHRTFNSDDLRVFIKCLRNIYKTHGGMEKIFANGSTNDSMQLAISEFKRIFFSSDHLERTEKHVSDPEKGSSAKRLNMMLRWFVRTDNRGVDFGIWNNSIKPSQLSLPLDVHTGNIARKLGILQRTQNDAKAVKEIDLVLRSFDPNDPVKYDFALFGLGAIDKF